MSEIVLIDPATQTALQQRRQRDRLRRFRYFPHLGLQVLAAHSGGHRVTILDERINAFDPRTLQADIVGITVRTALAPRAHQLAAEFSARGIAVVLGGPYVTLTPQRALADPAVRAIVEGPGEGVWQELLADFQNHRLKRRYRGRPLPASVLPRRDLPAGPYRPSTALLQITQGCSFRCKFCVIPKLYDHQFVVPAVDLALHRLADRDEKLLVFIDDNLIGNLPFARRLFAGLKGMGKRWFCQCTLNVARDSSLLALMSEAGCVMVNIGLETLSPQNWKEQNKGHNGCCEFSAAIRRLHDHGILVSGGFIFGFDNDDPTVFDRSLEFMDRSGIDYAACHILTPYPGLPFYDQLQREGRILTDDLSLYNTYATVFKPKKMTPQQLQEGFDRVVREFYSLRRLCTRLVHSLRTVEVYHALVAAFGGYVVRSNLNRGLPIHA